jgi:Xaa-Pro aminopeptidase
VDHQLRRRALGARLDDLGVEAMLVTSLVNVRYLTGFTGSNAQVLVGPEAATFLTDGRYEERSRHEVADLDRHTYARHYRDLLAGKVEAGGTTRLGFEAADVTVAAHAKLVAALPGIELVPVDDAVEQLRAVKDDEERGAIRRAQAATDASFDGILDVLAVGVTEQQVARELERLLREEGADGLAFDPIVAFGENAAEPHHEPSHRLLEEGDVVKLDFGGLVEGYHADMTRTLAFGSLAGELRKIHDVVREAQQAGIDTVRVGVAGSEVDAACRRVIEDAGYGDRFVHGTGHGVGLQIHEAPWLGREHDAPLPAGSVVTVEPGIYVPALGGVRIEDMVEVTEDGGRVVGTSTRDLIEL